jgi:hypothetical protein
MRKIRSIEFINCQHGWCCEIVFTLTTTYQFTDEEVAADGHARGHSLFSMILAWWRARRQMKENIREHGAKPGERMAKGWVD